MKVIQKWMLKDLNKDILPNRDEWKRIIHVINPMQFSSRFMKLSHVIGVKGLVFVVVVLYSKYLK